MKVSEGRMGEGVGRERKGNSTIIQFSSKPYTPQHNPIAKQGNKPLIEASRTVRINI